MPWHLLLIIVSFFVQPSAASDKTCNQQGHENCTRHDNAAVGLVIEDEEMPMSALQKQLDIETDTGNSNWGPILPTAAPAILAASCSLQELDRDLTRIAYAVEKDIANREANVLGWELDRSSAVRIVDSNGSDRVRIYKQYGDCVDSASSRYCTRSMTAGQCNSGNRLTDCRRTCGHCKPTCALAFSGSDGHADWQSNFRFDAVAVCGAPGVHRGFWNEASNILNGPEWPSIASVLANSCATKYAVGHSLGGAIATILAYCAGQEALGQYGATFSVDGLYTYGAPAVSSPALTNTSGSCFAGKRFFNIESHSYDPIPHLATVLGYLHPKVQAETLYVNEQRVVSSTSLSCSLLESGMLPTGSIGHLRAPLHALSSMYYYVSRTDLIFNYCGN